jgi:hypothetical protein
MKYHLSGVCELCERCMYGTMPLPTNQNLLRSSHKGIKIDNAADR